MQTRTFLLGLVGLGISVAACTSEVAIGDGATAPGGVGQSPRADGTCDPGLTSCRGQCTLAACSVVDAGTTVDATDSARPDAPTNITTPPQVVAQGRTGPNGIAVASGFVYWTERGTPLTDNTGQGSVMRAPVQGGAATTIASTQDGPSGLAVDGSSVYWTNIGHTSSVNQVYSGGAVMTGPIVGGQVPTVVAPDQEVPVQIGLTGSYVYYAANGLINPTPGKVGLWRVAIGGGAPERLFAVGGLGSHHVGVNPSSLVWTGPNVLRTDLNGVATGSPFLWSSTDSSFAWDLAIDNSAAYWTNKNTGKLLSVPLAGGSAKELSSGGLGDGQGIAIDGTHVYWIACVIGLAAKGCSVQRVPLAGGATQTIASAQTAAAYVALDSGFVYWTTADAVLRAPK